MKTIDRNSKKEIKADVSHLKKMLGEVNAHLEKSDNTRIEYVGEMITDWMSELQSKENKFAISDEAFFGGLLTACICIHHFDQPVIIEEIMGTLGDDNKKAFIQFAKDNGEYQLAGLDEYEEHVRVQEENAE